MFNGEFGETAMSNAFAEAVADGRLFYNASLAEGCLQAVASAPCGHLPEECDNVVRVGFTFQVGDNCDRVGACEPLAFCSRALPGQAVCFASTPTGSPCTTEEECGSNASCAGVEPPWRCLPHSAVGQSCRGVSCEFNLYCGSDGLCRAPGLGDPCMAYDSFECGRGLVCLRDDPERIGVCIERNCRVYKTGDRCGRGRFCGSWLLTCDQEGICRPGGMPGDACSPRGPTCWNSECRLNTTSSGTCVERTSQELGACYRLGCLLAGRMQFVPGGRSFGLD